MLIAIVALIVIVFNSFSNPRVRSYFSSISIASSFWQAIFLVSKIPNITWPSGSSNAFEASSIFSLQFDFLSPECLFRDLPYEVKFIGWCVSPLLILFLFILYYAIVDIRSRIAKCINARILHVPFWACYEKTRKKEALWQYVQRSILNEIVYVRNYLVWLLNREATAQQLAIFRDNTICSFFVFLFFAYGNIVSTTMDLFNCLPQPDGSRSLVSSPDIVCFGGRWWIMLPFAMIILALVNLVIFGVYFNMVTALWYNNQKLTKSFKRKFRFMLFRFHKRFFYWNAVLSMKQILITLLVTFLKPSWIIVLVLGVIFGMLLMHMNCVPYKKKFHNMYTCNAFVLIYFVAWNTFA